MPTEKEVLNGLLSRVYQFDNDGVTSLYNEDGSELKDDALDAILAKDAERVASLKPDTKKIQDDWYKKGQSESLTKYEQSIASKYGLKTDKKGIEFIDELVSQFQKITDDDPDKIRKSKIFLDELDKIKKESEKSAADIKNEFDTYKKTVESEKLFGIVANDALIQLDGMNPILPKDPAVASNLKRIFINSLKAQAIDERDGVKVLVNPDGTDTTDNHGHRIPFEKFVESTAKSLFEFQVSDPKNAAPHDKNKPKTTVFNIQSEADYLRLRNEVKPEDKPALLEAYQKFRGKK